tara:strand:- start:7297 stop:7638 length:342 start_codon:yes stop_codon:yes gene_type:complete
MVGNYNTVVSHSFGRHSHWQGRSGRSYDMISENLDHFALGDTELYLLAKGNHVLWVGATSELVGDPLSRARFRLALDCADRVFRLVTPGTEAQRLSTIWDLEGAEPVTDVRAA